MCSSLEREGMFPEQGLRNEEFEDLKGGWELEMDQVLLGKWML